MLPSTYTGISARRMTATPRRVEISCRPADSWTSRKSGTATMKIRYARAGQMVLIAGQPSTVRKQPHTATMKPYWDTVMMELIWPSSSMKKPAPSTISPAMDPVHGTAASSRARVAIMNAATNGIR